MLFLLTDFLQKLKLEKFHGALIILLYVSPSSPPLQFRFKENGKVLSKNSHSREYYNFNTEFAFFNSKHTKEQPLFSKWLVGKYQI